MTHKSNCIEILKIIRCKTESQVLTPFQLERFDEAIAELETLQQRIAELESPRTCDGCRSTSIGDIIIIEGYGSYVVNDCGFKPLYQDDL